MKKSKQIVPICIIAAIALFVFVAYMLIKGSLEELNSASSQNQSAQQELEQIQLQEQEISAKQKKNELELSSIKPIFKAPEGSDGQSITSFPDFKGLLGEIVHTENLYLRSMEYKLNPEKHPLVADFSEQYNVCEVKLFLVGTYFSLHKFLDKFIGGYPNLVSIAQMDVSTYPDNTDYILIHLTVDLYAQKTAVKR